jgi:hypothetical protein
VATLAPWLMSSQASVIAVGRRAAPSTTLRFGRRISRRSRCGSRSCERAVYR